MESFHWDQHFVTGLDEVDRQHHHLVDLINSFGELLTLPGGVTYADIEAVFKELAAYAQYHFTEEEAQMEREGVDPRHREYHCQEHAGFMEEVARMHAGVSPANLDAAGPLLKFLVYWLAYHILGSDQHMARQIAAIHAGQSAADAYLAEERMKEGAVEPLLHALTGLFQQVSERNRELLQLNQTLETKVTERTHALSDANRELTGLVRKLEAEQEESRRLSSELAIANKHLEDIALTDALTGLPNRRHAIRRLERAWTESGLDGTPLSCMMVDADGFKQINDTYGHDAGDEVLRQLARALRHAVRTDDVVCRLGGDEFLIICPRTPLDGAMHFAELTRRAIAELRVPAGGGEWHGSISVGVAVRNAGMRGPDDLIKAADDAVYLAKRNGRNCVATLP